MLKPAQIILLGGITLLGVSIWFADRSGPEKVPAQVQQAAKTVAPIQWDNILDTALAEIRRKEASGEAAVTAFLADPASKSTDSLAGMMRAAQKGPASAYLLEKKARKTGSAEDWLNSGREYYRNISQVKENYREALYQKAMLCFGKANELKPSQPEILTALGTCFVEGSNNPMEGIGFLREAIQLDSLYVPAHLQLGVFAMQSGQWERAESRMNKVLQIDPNASIALLYLGEIYKQLNQKDKALEALQTYRNRLSDPLLRDEVDGYIKQLKNS